MRMSVTVLIWILFWIKSVSIAPSGLWNGSGGKSALTQIDRQPCQTLKPLQNQQKNALPQIHIQIC
jgi:hypothetical protein